MREYRGRSTYDRQLFHLCECSPPWFRCLLNTKQSCRRLRQKEKPLLDRTQSHLDFACWLCSCTLCYQTANPLFNWSTLFSLELELRLFQISKHHTTPFDLFLVEWCSQFLKKSKTFLRLRKSFLRWQFRPRFFLFWFAFALESYSMDFRFEHLVAENTLE